MLRNGALRYADGHLGAVRNQFGWLVKGAYYKLQADLPKESKRIITFQCMVNITIITTTIPLTTSDYISEDLNKIILELNWNKQGSEKRIKIKPESVKITGSNLIAL